MKILAFGDSNTWGYNPATGGRYSVYWTKILGGKLPSAEVINEGLCGRTAAFDDPYRGGLNGLSALAEILRNDFDFAIIMLGTNDCKAAFRADAELVGKGVEKCVDEILKKVAAEKILIVSPILLSENVLQKNFGYDENSLLTSRGLKAVFSDIAKKKGTLFLAAEDIAKASDIDCEHLTGEGHERLAEAIYEILKTVGL